MDHSHCRTRAGTPTLALVEVYCQRGYILFQVVQVFSVTTLTHDLDFSNLGSLSQIPEDPHVRHYASWRAWVVGGCHMPLLHSSLIEMMCASA